MHRLPILASALLLLALVAPPAAAGSYDNCVGFIDALPATITTQGTWCLRRNLSTGITSGQAIDVKANNVTIDCQDFKIGGMAGGPSSMASGIHAHEVQNTTVRHCAIRGFQYGVLLYGGAGHLVEDNRFDNNLDIGIYLTGVNSVVRRNLVYDTGNGTGVARGILATGHIQDNIITGVLGGEGATGISTNGTGTDISGNVISGLATATGQAVGIYSWSSYNMVRGNRLADYLGHVPSTAISMSEYGYSVCADNLVTGFSTVMVNCQDGG